MAENPFPDPPSIKKDDPEAEVKKLHYQTWLEVMKAEKLAEIEKAKEERQTFIKRQETVDRKIESGIENDRAIDLKFYEAYIDVAKGQIDRAISRAQAVQTAAAAVGSAYTALLSYVFVVSSEVQNPLPFRGVISTVFAGLAILCSTAFIAYITDFEKITVKSAGDGLIGKQRRTRNAFIRWTREISGHRRLAFLRLSIMFLGASVTFLPAAFIEVTDFTAVIVAGVIIIGILLSSLPEEVEARN